MTAIDMLRSYITVMSVKQSAEDSGGDGGRGTCWRLVQLCLLDLADDTDPA